MKAEIRRSAREDIDVILSDLRQADDHEMRALGITPRKALEDGFDKSDWSMTGLIDGTPVCMFGVAPHNVILGQGTPWMLSTNAIESAQVLFLRACRPVVKWMTASYPSLSNVVHTENTTAIRWLRWLGFKFCCGSDGAMIRVEINGAHFHVFFMGY